MLDEGEEGRWGSGRSSHQVNEGGEGGGREREGEASTGEGVVRKAMTLLLPFLSLALGRGKGVSGSVMVPGFRPQLPDSLLCGSCFAGVNEAG